MSSIRVIVVDDQQITREGLVARLNLLEDIEVVAEAGDGPAALHLVAQHRPDAVLIDLRTGVEATHRITADHPGVAVLALTTYADDESIATALRSAAAATTPRTNPDGLTAREREILALMATGLSNPEIATRLYIGQTTVKTHINNTFAKIGAHNRAEAVNYANQHGLAQP